MEKVKRIQVISKKITKNQVLKDHLTVAEKKAIIFMLNFNFTTGKVRNKVYKIEKTGANLAEVTIYTTEKSIVLGTNETTKRIVKIKYN